jgi:hypothetical protein
MTDSLLYHARASKGIANQPGGSQPIQVMLVETQLFSIYMAKVEQ